MKTIGYFLPIFLVMSFSTAFASETDVRDVSVSVPKTEHSLDATGSRVERRQISLVLSSAYWNPGDLQFSSRSSVATGRF
ncbi:MAG: hypothetical protein AABZ55_07060, partial [Bdellovibrionota bacterium]